MYSLCWQFWDTCTLQVTKPDLLSLILSLLIAESFRAGKYKHKIKHFVGVQFYQDYLQTYLIRTDEYKN